jgi:hypothetical protein
MSEKSVPIYAGPSLSMPLPERQPSDPNRALGELPPVLYERVPPPSVQNWRNPATD